MKSVLLCLVLIAAAFADNNECLLNTGAPGTACFSTNDCALGLSCVTGLCQFVDLGKSCTADPQCGGLYPFCISGQCDAKRIPGDPCTIDEQCISGQCSGTCVAKQLNEACGGSDCAPGLWCNPMTRVCSNKLAVGANCSNEYLAIVSNISFAHDLTTMCADSALCDFVINANAANSGTGVCTPIFSATQSCGAFGSFTCSLGSTCVCQSINDNDDNNNCGGALQCGGVSTFCACEENQDQDFQVFNSTQVAATPVIQTGTVPVTGTQVPVTGGVTISTNNQGTCQIDNCLNSFAPDYYGCLLQNGCGLASEPVFIDGSCANGCAFLFSRIKCCQAGLQPLISNQEFQNNGNMDNSLQRSVALPPQIQCVAFQERLVSSSSTLESGIIVVASLLAALVF